MLLLNTSSTTSSCWYNHITNINMLIQPLHQHQHQQPHHPFDTITSLTCWYNHITNIIMLIQPHHQHVDTTTSTTSTYWYKHINFKWHIFSFQTSVNMNSLTHHELSLWCTRNVISTSAVMSGHQPTSAWTSCPSCVTTRTLFCRHAFYCLRHTTL